MTTASLPSVICFGIACIFSLAYGKLDGNHPLKIVPFAGMLAFFIVGSNL